MIESAARCLETGGRAALRVNRKQLRSRRHLHSAFWSHGAGNIDLPAWWIFLLQTPATTDEVDKSRRKGEIRNAVSTGLQDIFLDFLYPVQTLALIRRLKRSATAHHHAAQNVKSYSRSYTSIAKEFITGVKAPRIDAEAFSTSTAANEGEDRLRKTINELIDSKEHPGTHDELWRSYQDLLEVSPGLPPQGLIRMFRCLITSESTVDLERALALFESIPIHERRAIHYSHAVSASLALKDLDTAVSMHREALSRINYSIGTAAILGFAVQQDLWSVAIEIWHRLWEHKLAYYTRPDIWAAVDALPLDDLISKASAAAEFAAGFVATDSEFTQGHEAVHAREFALELARRAFSPRETEFDIHQHLALVDKITPFDNSDKLIRIHALNQLLSFSSDGHANQALHVYRNLRKEPAFLPSHNMVKSLFRRAVRIKDAVNLSMIMDDWRQYCATLPTIYAISAARVFAYNGQIDATQKLFDDVVLHYGRPTDQMYDSMLLVHERRADTEGILRCLQHLKEIYGYEPGLTAWNYVIATFARVGDVDGALDYFEKLRETGIRPDSSTYFLLMSMYGKRGDRDAVDELYEQSKDDGVPTTIKMVNAIVLANVKDGSLEKAEQFVDQALDMDIAGPRTFMWNVLINAYALRKDVEKVSQLHKRMQELRVPSDNMTYAALMTSLTVAKFPDGARKILRVMHRQKIKQTALHYAILMGGYLATREYHRVFGFYQEMLRFNFTPNMSTQNVLLRAAASVDKAAMPAAEDGGDVPDHVDFVRAREVFEHTLENLDPMELAASEPRLFTGANPLNEAFSSTYFEYLIFLYGTDKAFNKASELYERYISTPLPLRGNDRNIEENPPVRLLTALMVCHIRTGNYSEVDRCWNLALEKSMPLVQKSRADTMRGGWVLHSRRFIMNLPLHHYTLALMQQDRTADLLNTVSDLQDAGYDLNSSNYNKYVQALAGSPETTHRILAFQACEQELMTDWDGWSALRASHLRPRLMNKFAGAARSMMIKQDKRWPAYLTFVYLARAYLEAKSQGRFGLGRQLEQLAPRTIDAVTNMPRFNDRPQSEILRREA